jgi:hypothetical protein
MGKARSRDIVRQLAPVVIALSSRPAFAVDTDPDLFLLLPILALTPIVLLWIVQETLSALFGRGVCDHAIGELVAQAIRGLLRLAGAGLRAPPRLLAALLRNLLP